jgi:VWFA-related protein
MNPRSSRTAGFIAVLACASAVAPGLSSAAQAPTGGEQAPRPVASVPKPVANETQGRIRLDAVVTDAAGKPASGLTRQDFKLLDNDRPTTIASFQASDGAQDPPIAVILVIDLVNSTADDVISARTQLSKYLRQNNGQLVNPVLIVAFAPDGLQMQSQPSTDGNTLASFVDQLKPAPAPPPGQSVAVSDQFSQSLETLTAVADVALHEPGRKVLFWAGKGWAVPKADDPNMSMGENDANIGALVALTNKLREARIVIYGGDPAFHRDINEGMTNLQKLDPATLSLGALAQRTGGHGVARNDLAGEINRAIANSAAHYTLSFSPPATDHPDEYHAIKLLPNQPKLTVHTIAGYYSESPAQ